MKVPIWQGFDHYWQMEPHRLNRFGSRVEFDGGVESCDGAFCSSMTIGRFPADTCHTHTMIHRIGTDTTGAVSGSATADLSGAIGERVERSGKRVEVEIPGEGLTATVVMRGFELESVGFGHGFQTRGFGFSIQDISVEPIDGGLRVAFRPHYFIFPDLSPDPFTDSNRFVWRLLPFPQNLEPNTPDGFTYRMTLHYSVIFDQAGCMAVTDARVRTRARSTLQNPPEDHVEIAGDDGGYSAATIGIRGFCWELLPWDRTRYDGRYLRKLKFVIDGMSYDPAGGTMTCIPKMTFNNFGGRQGREHVRRWIAFLRHRRHYSRERLRALVRSLRGSYGYDAEYHFALSLIQFKGVANLPVSRFYNTVRKEAEVRQSFLLGG